MSLPWQGGPTSVLCGTTFCLFMAWEFHMWICLLIKSTPHSPQIPPKVFYQDSLTTSFVLFLRSLSPLNAAGVNLAVGPSAGAWAAYRVTFEGNWQSVSQQLSVASSSSVSLGTWWAPLPAALGFWLPWSCVCRQSTEFMRALAWHIRKALRQKSCTTSDPYTRCAPSSAVTSEPWRRDTL